MSKWLWKLKKDRNSLCSKFITGKYGEETLENIFEGTPSIIAGISSNFLKDLSKVSRPFNSSMRANK